MSVSCECCVLSGRGLCDGLITRPEKSSRACAFACVCVFAHVSSSVIWCKNNPLHLQCIGRSGKTKKKE
jgi:hypothetical protein